MENLLWDFKLQDKNIISNKVTFSHVMTHLLDQRYIKISRNNINQYFSKMKKENVRFLRLGIICSFGSTNLFLLNSILPYHIQHTLCTQYITYTINVFQALLTLSIQVVTFRTHPCHITDDELFQLCHYQFTNATQRSANTFLCVFWNISVIFQS